MRAEVNFFKNILWISLLFLSAGLFAQTIDDAKKLFNEGAEAVQAEDMELAVTKFEECIEICNTLYAEEEDEEAEELMYTVQEKVPKLYYSMATTKLQNKDFKGGLESAYKARESADNYGDDATLEKANTVISKVHYQIGASKYKGSDLDAAIAELDKAIEVKPDYASPYYMKAVILKKQNNDEAFKTTCKEGLTACANSNDTKTEAKIVKLAHGHYLKKGNEEKGAGKNDEAIASLESAMTFDPTDATAPYLLASVYESLEKYDNAITTAEKALANESSSEEKGKIYMIIGNAYFQKGDKSAACDAYGKVTSGQYAELATYRMEHEIKCGE